MWRISDSFAMIYALSAAMSLSAGQPGVSPSDAPDLPELKTEKGDIFVNVFVKRIETSALVIRHDGGMARVSLFDLSPALQAKYNFDPVMAMKTDLRLSAAENERRRSLMLDRQRSQADLERARKESDLIRQAKADWIPVEARVVRPMAGGVIVRAMRITLIPTRIRSTLGFPKDGPHKKVLEPFTPELILLHELIPTGSRDHWQAGDLWKGYLNPVPDGNAPSAESGGKSIPVHGGVAQNP